MRVIKQVIVMRKDLNMRKGKMVAQGAHASLAAMLTAFNRTYARDTLTLSTPDECTILWLSNSFTKVCVYVNSEQELIDIYNKANANKDIPSALITDAGKTEFNGVPTKTCCAIGPAYEEDIDKITGGLPLL